MSNGSLPLTSLQNMKRRIMGSKNFKLTLFLSGYMGNHSIKKKINDVAQKAGST